MDTEGTGARFVARDHGRLLTVEQGRGGVRLGPSRPTRPSWERRTSSDLPGDAMYVIFDGVAGLLRIPTNSLEELNAMLKKSPALH